VKENNEVKGGGGGGGGGGLEGIRTHLALRSMLNLGCVQGEVLNEGFDGR